MNNNQTTDSMKVLPTDTDAAGELLSVAFTMLDTLKHSRECLRFSTERDQRRSKELIDRSSKEGDLTPCIETYQRHVAQGAVMEVMCMGLETLLAMAAAVLSANTLAGIQSNIDTAMHKHSGEPSI